MDNNLAERDKFIETLLLERDELYQELSMFRNAEGGALELAQKKNLHYEGLIKDKDDLIKKLTDQLAWYRRKFWNSSSEKFIPEDPAQRKIEFDGLDVLPEEEEAAKVAVEEIITYKRKKPEAVKKQPVRLPLPEHLRREDEVIEPEDIDDRWVRIGEEITEILDYKPGEVFVRRIIRTKYALKKEIQKLQETGNIAAPEKVVKIAQLPRLPLPRSYASPSLMAELIMGKYYYHMPFHRQISLFKLAGISIPASTINDWFTGISDLIRALYYRLRELVLKSDYIQVDESTVPVINDEKHRAVKAYLWVVRSVIDNLMFFHYDKGSRTQKVVIELLRDFQGAVQTDGYDAYSIYENKKGVLLLGCLAHARSYQYL